jgi:hypothetical protein
MSNESNRHKGMLLFYITEAVKEGKIKKIQETENSDGDYSLNILEVFNFFTQKDMEFHINPLELEVLMTSAEKRELFSDWANLQLCKKRHSYLHVLSGIVLLVETAYEIYRDGGQNNFSDKFRKFLDGFSRKNIDYSCWEFVNEQIKNADQEVMTLVKPYIENWDILREDIIEILEKLKEKGEGDSSQKAAVFCRWYGMVCFLAFNEFVAPSDEGQSVTLKELIQFPTNYLKKGLFWGVELREVKEDTFYGNLSKLCSKGDFPFYKASKARTAPFLFDPDEKHKINLFHEEMGFLRRKSDDDKTSSKKEKKSNSQNKSKPEKK